MKVLLVPLAAIAGVFVLMAAARLWMAFSLLLRLRFRPGGARLADPDELPRELDPVFRAGGDALEALGFRYVAAMWIDSPETAEPPRPAHVWGHDGSGTTATLTPALFYNGSRPFDVAFETGWADGTVVLTGDSIAHVMFPLPETWEFHDGYSNDLDAQWRRHLEALEAHRQRGAPLAPDAETVLERNRACLGSAVERWRAMELLARDTRRPEGARLHARAALGFARRLLKGTDRVSRLEREQARATTVRARSPDVWNAAEVHALERAAAIDAARKSPRGLRWALLLVSLPLSALALGILFGWELVASLLIVLFVHELGHAAGMVLFGYRNAQIFFLPFLGAAATGAKDDATPFQELVVLLLGPVPGIVIGFWLLSTSQPGSWWWELGLVALVLNYLNLVPIMPLDGGRIVETVLLGTFPRAQFFFVAASAVAAGGVGLLMGDGILQFLAIVLALGLPAKWRWSQGARRLRRDLRPGMDRRAQTEAVYRVLEEPAFTRLGQGQRLVLAQSLLRFAVRPRARPAVVVLGLLLYAVALLGPPVGWFVRTSGAHAVQAEEPFP